LETCEFFELCFSIAISLLEFPAVAVNIAISISLSLEMLAGKTPFTLSDAAIVVVVVVSIVVAAACAAGPPQSTPTSQLSFECVRLAEQEVPLPVSKLRSWAKNKNKNKNRKDNIEQSSEVLYIYINI